MDHFRLKGRVKRVHEQRFSLQNISLPKLLQDEMFLSFNTTGQLTLEKSINYHCALKGEGVAADFDVAGNILQKKIYDAFGALLCRVTYQNKGEGVCLAEKYDAKDRMEEIRIIKTDPEKYFEVQENFSPSLDFRYRYETSYDPRFNVVEDKQFQGDDWVSHFVRVNSPLKNELSVADPRCGTTVVSFTDKLQEYLWHFRSGILDREEIITKTDNGDFLKKEIFHKGRRFEVICTYQRDEHDNWIEQYTESNLGRVPIIAKRIFEYYPD